MGLNRWNSYTLLGSEENVIINFSGPYTAAMHGTTKGFDVYLAASSAMQPKAHAWSVTTGPAGRLCKAMVVPQSILTEL